MQLSHQPAVSIGCEAGGPEARLPCDLKVGLYQVLAKHVTSSQCEAVNEYALVLRIDGSLAKYGPEGVHRVRLSKARRYVSAEIQVPESAWQHVGMDDLRAYLAGQVRNALQACVQRLRKDKIAVAEGELFTQVDAAIIEYLGSGGAPNNSFKPNLLRKSA